MKKTTSSNLFFDKIAQYRKLTRQEEDTEINKIILSKKILKEAATSNNYSIVAYLKIIKIRDRVEKEISRKILKSEWAKLADCSVEQLDLLIKLGRSEWAKLVQIPVKNFNLIQKQGIEARKKLIVHNLHLVATIASRYQNRGLEIPDLIQEGVIGLSQAIELFDSNKKIGFSKFARYQIEREIISATNNYYEKIGLRIPTLKLLLRIQTIRQELFLISGRYPSLTEIAKSLRISVQKIINIMDEISMVLSMNRKVNRELARRVVDSIDSRKMDKEEDFNLIEVLLKEINQLDSRGREVIRLRYLQENQQPLQRIGALMDIDPRTVRKIETNAIERLRSLINVGN